MAEIIHGETCECCKNLSQPTKRALTELNDLMGTLGVANEKDKTLANLKAINSNLQPVGGIDDIVALAERFFAIDFDSLDISKLEPLPPLEPVVIPPNASEAERKRLRAAARPTLEAKTKARETMLNKKVGKFKLGDITDNPFIDISKAMSFAGLPLDALSNLKMSLVVPSFTVEKSLNFGVASLGIKFFVSLKEISWGPAMEVLSPEKALSMLAGATTTAIADRTTTQSLQQLQKLADAQLRKTNPEAADQLKKATSKEEFFNFANDLKVNISVTVNMGDEATALLKDKEQSAALSQGRDLAAVGLEASSSLSQIKVPPTPVVEIPANPGPDFDASSLVKEAIEEVRANEKEILKQKAKKAKKAVSIKDIDKCEPRKPSFAKFKPDEVEKVIPCAVEAASTRPLEIKASEGLKQIQDALKDIPTAQDAESQVKELKNFIGKVEEANAEMQKCADTKNKATNRLFFLKEAQILHSFVHTYLRERAERFSYTTVEAIFIERDRLLKEAADIRAKIMASSNKLASLLKVDPNIPGLFANPSPAQLPSNISTVSIGVVSSWVTSSKNALATTEYNIYKKLVDQYNTTVDLVNQQKAKFNDLGSQNLSADELALVTPGSNGEPFDTKLVQIRRRLLAKNNPITNLAGFDDDGKALLFINRDMSSDTPAEKAVPNLLTDMKSRSTAATSTVIGGSQTFQDYFRGLEYNFIPSDIQPEIRRGLLEEGLWKKYYSANRIDALFDWREQGYSAPKPVFNDKGEVQGATEKVEITNGLGQKMVQDVPTSVKECIPIPEIAVPFLANIEKNTENKVDNLAQSIMNGPEAQAYMKSIKYYAKLEAILLYNQYTTLITFNTSTQQLQASAPQVVLQEYQASAKIYDSINNFYAETQKVIADAQACIDAQQKNIENAAKAFAKKTGGGTESETLKKKCKEKLGSDPIGKPGTPSECPGYTKNCYWEEYTKLMQMVSLMPIPEADPTNLAKRLFRYYPVALQIPVPAPPGILPTLAMGIPDPQISIPLPYIWKHLIAIQTPIGLFVVWIALAGGIIPNPFIMYVDEKQNTMFLVAGKTPLVNIPSSSLNVQSIEFQSLLDLIQFEKSLKVSFNSPLGRLLSGSTRGSAFNPDDPTSFIEDIKGRITGALNGLEIPDPTFAGKSPRAIEAQQKIEKALKYIPPDLKIIEEALDDVLGLAKSSVDSLRIPSVTIPKDKKYMMMELPPVLEMLDTFNGLLEKALNSPADVAEIVLGNIGAGVKTLNVPDTINQAVRVAVDRPEVKQKLLSFDTKIDQIEAKIASSAAAAEGATTAALEAAAQRVQVVKDLIKGVIQDIVKIISNPKFLGLLAFLELPFPLPFPCYSNVEIPPLPPFVNIILGLIQTLPELIDTLPPEQIAELLSGVLDLQKPLPAAEALFYIVINSFIGLVPNLALPVGFDFSVLKQILVSLKNWLASFHIRLPKPGLPAPLVVPGSLIKTIVKEALGIFLDVIKSIFMQKLNQAINAVGPERTAIIFSLIATIKLLFGTELHKIKGADVKAFISSVLEAVAFPPLDAVKSLIQIATALAGPFLSIKDLFLPNSPFQIAVEQLKKLIEGEPPFYYFGAEILKAFLQPFYDMILPLIANALPYPLILLGCSFPVSRIILTKIHPVKAVEKLPTWEGLTLKNIPFVVWLDQMIATAQRGAILGSDYVAPYFTPPTGP